MLQPSPSVFEGKAYWEMQNDGQKVWYEMYEPDAKLFSLAADHMLLLWGLGSGHILHHFAHAKQFVLMAKALSSDSFPEAGGTFRTYACDFDPFGCPILPVELRDYLKTEYLAARRQSLGGSISEHNHRRILAGISTANLASMHNRIIQNEIEQAKKEQPCLKD